MSQDIDIDALGEEDPSTTHPINDDSIDRAVDKHDTDDLDREQIHVALREVQGFLESDFLREMLSWTREGDTGLVERIYQDDNVWIFADYDYRGWETILEGADVEDPTLQSIVQDAHLFEAEMCDTERDGTDDDLIDDSSWDTFMIGKSPRWRKGEKEIMHYFVYLSYAGLSPAQLIDYWACHITDEPQKNWGLRRGVKPPTVHENVTTAHQLIEQAEEEVDDPIDMNAKRAMRGYGWIWAEENIKNQFRSLANSGLSCAEMLDYWACEMQNAKQTEWAYVRSVDQSTVSENVNTGREKVNNEYYDTPSRSEVYEEMEEHYDA